MSTRRPPPARPTPPHADRPPRLLPFGPPAEIEDSDDLLHALRIGRPARTGLVIGLAEPV